MPTPRLYPTAAARQAAYRERLAEARTQELAAKGMPALPAVAALPGNPRWRALTEQAKLLLQTVEEEMRTYFEQRSSAWQESDRGEAFLDRLDGIREAQGAVQEVQW